VKISRLTAPRRVTPRFSGISAGDDGVFQHSEREGSL
jgi:hypothetical protein